MGMGCTAPAGGTVQSGPVHGAVEEEDPFLGLSGPMIVLDHRTLCLLPPLGPEAGSGEPQPQHRGGGQGWGVDSSHGEKAWA